MFRPDRIPLLRSHLALALVPQLGPRLTAALLEKFGTPEAILAAAESDLKTVPLVGDKLAKHFAESFRQIDVDAEIALISKHDVGNLVLGEADYPRRLAEVGSAPPLLYHRGAFEPVDLRGVGIVGSRSCTSYGKKVTEQLAAGLVRAGWTVVSGLARGIDGVAHRAALDAGGRTIAVLAGGLSRIYPPEHKDLAEAIVGRGVLVTETPMTVDPQPGMFPARNRIISALSRAVVIVEANAKSGALITATHAAEQGREVYVVPGNVDSPASAGCLELLRKGARLIRGVDDLLEDLRGLSPGDPDPASPAAPTLFDEPAGPPPGLTAPQLAIWTALTQPTHADELGRTLGMPTGDLLTGLLQLELRKVVRRLPGNRFERR
jgi:DNA processing protein